MPALAPGESRKRAIRVTVRCSRLPVLYLSILDNSMNKWGPAGGNKSWTNCLKFAKPITVCFKFGKPVTFLKAECDRVVFPAQAERCLF
jgi:hypothetical protein